MQRYKKIRPAGAAPALAGATRRLFTRSERKDRKAGLPEASTGWLALMTKLGLLYGGAWLFTYCFFTIEFFPSGISAADSVFLFFVAVGFGLVVLLVAGFGLHVVDPWLGLLGEFVGDPRKDGRTFPIVGSIAALTFGGLVCTLAVAVLSDSSVTNFEWYVLLSGLPVAHFFVAYSVKKHGDPKIDVGGALGTGFLSALSHLLVLALVVYRQWWALQFVVLQGVLAAALLSVWRSPRHAKDRGLGIWLLSILNLFAPIYLSVLFKGDQAISPTLALTFERLGLYHDAADVILSNKAAQQVWQLGTDHGMGLQGCQLEDGAVLISRVQVLWHGVGTRSLLRIPDADWPSALTQRRIEFDSADVRLLSKLPQQCAQLATEIHFASRTTDPLDAGEIDELNESFRQAIERAPKGWRLATVQLRGHADPMPLAKNGNVDLGLARAKVVGAQLVNQFHLAESVRRGVVSIDVQSSASRSGRSGSCPFKGDQASLEECHSRSRRVEVRLIFKPFEV